MGFLFGKKKKDKKNEKQEVKDPNELSNPGMPTADTIELVNVAGVLPPFIITQNGSFVLLLEVPEIDMDITGQVQTELYYRYQMALAALPPHTKFQMTIIEEPIDAEADIRAFYSRAKQYSEEMDLLDPESKEHKQVAALCNSATVMMAQTAEWFDRIRPTKRRTIITMSYLPGLANVAKTIVKGQQYAKVNMDSIAKNYDKAMENLSQRLSILQQAFQGAGLPLEVLSPEDGLRAIWRALHPISPLEPDTDASDIARSMVKEVELYKKMPPTDEEINANLEQENLIKLLAPDYVVERHDLMEIDGVLLAGYIVNDFVPNRNTLMYRLNDLEGGWIGSIHIEVMDAAIAAEKLSQRETQLTAQEMMKEKQGMLMNFSTHQEVGAVQSSRMRLETSGEAPININFVVFRTAKTLKELNARCLDMESLFKTIGVLAYRSKYTQSKVWSSYMPLGVYTAEVRPRNMDSASLSSFFWPQKRRYNEEGGVYVGIDNSTGLPLFLDPFGARGNKTPTFLAVGRPGAGKTVWLRTMMTSAMVSGGRVMAVDIEGELKEYCNYYGGRYIEVGTARGDLINVLDLPLDADDPLATGTEHLISFCEAVRGAPIPQGPEWNAIAEAYKRVLIDREYLSENDDGSFTVHDEDWDAQNAPRLSDITAVLGRNNDAVSESLYQMLTPYVNGGVYSNYFDKATSFNIRDERLVIFGLQNVNSHANSNQLRVYLWQILGLIWSEVLWRFAEDKTVANNVMLDEVWALLKAPGGVGAIENMARRFRKRRAGLWLATQEVGEFLDSPDAKKILSIVGNTFLMDQRPTEARLLQNIYTLPDSFVTQLTHLGTGHGLMMLPDKTLDVSVIIPPEWHSY